MTKHDDNKNGPIHDNANQESQGKREQFVSELIHEFTNAITAVIGYSGLGLNDIERCNPEATWPGKIKNHTTQLASLVRKLTALNSSAKWVTNDEC